MVDGAGQHGCTHQLVGQRVVLQPFLQWAFFQVGLVMHIAVIDQHFGRFAAKRRALALTGAQLEQLTHGQPADANGEVVFAEAELFPIGLAGLQSERAQTQGDAEASAPLRVSQRIEDAAVSQGLAAACGGQVDAEETVPG